MRRAAVAFAIALTGCAGISKHRGHDEVSALVEKQSGFPTGWAEGTPEAAQISARVDALLDGGLTHAGAIQIALINNPALQATYEELGIAQAEMAQAGMLSNPSIGASVGFPYPSMSAMVEIELSLVQNLLDLFMLPIRRSRAAEQFTADTLRVAHEALGVTAEVSEALIRTQAAQRWVALRETFVEGARGAAELAARQREAGNISELSYLTERASLEQARLALSDAELQLVEHREALNRLLGLWGPRTGWAIKEGLAELPASDPPLDHLESLAVQRRIDLEALRKQDLLMINAVGLARSSWFLGTIEVGVHAKRDNDGARLIGPSLVIELPIFDQRGAMISKLEAQQRQSERRLAAASVAARSEVRVARAQLIQKRQRVEHFKTALLPLRERIVELAQLHYNGMFLSPYELLSLKREQVEAYGGYIEAVSDYWLARNALERATGGSLISHPIPTENEHGSHPH